jgi:hypothetical protein
VWLIAGALGGSGPRRLAQPAVQPVSLPTSSAHWWPSCPSGEGAQMYRDCSAPANELHVSRPDISTSGAAAACTGGSNVARLQQRLEPYLQACPAGCVRPGLTRGTAAGPHPRPHARLISPQPRTRTRRHPTQAPPVHRIQPVAAAPAGDRRAAAARGTLRPPRAPPRRRCRPPRGPPPRRCRLLQGQARAAGALSTGS